MSYWTETPRWRIYDIMPRFVKIWHNNRRYWKRMQQIHAGAENPTVLFYSALACAELNQRLGDDSLWQRLDRASKKIRG